MIDWELIVSKDSSAPTLASFSGTSSNCILALDLSLVVLFSVTLSAPLLSVCKYTLLSSPISSLTGSGSKLSPISSRKLVTCPLLLLGLLPLLLRPSSLSNLRPMSISGEAQACSSSSKAASSGGRDVAFVLRTFLSSPLLHSLLSAFLLKLTNLQCSSPQCQSPSLSFSRSARSRSLSRFSRTFSCSELPSSLTLCFLPFFSLSFFSFTSFFGFLSFSFTSFVRSLFLLIKSFSFCLASSFLSTLGSFD